MTAVFPVTFWLLFATAMLISSIGFYKYVYFISLGYGFSIAGLGLLILAMFWPQQSVATMVCCVLFAIYGCRLGGFLLLRELKSSSYNRTCIGQNRYGFCSNCCTGRYVYRY